ncbi:MAG: biopolymer transporter ExbD [Planctomycetota bacterium]
MKIREDAGSEEAVVNLTPMIDVVFLLLIFFMVTTTFLDPEREIEIDLPTADSAGAVESPPEEIIITVRSDGTVFVRGELRDDDGLRSLLRSAAQHDPETPVTIRGDREAHHEAIVGVMDACGSAGLYNLAVGTTTTQRGG